MKRRGYTHNTQQTAATRQVVAGVVIVAELE